MSESEHAAGLISSSELEEVAIIFDRFEFAIDPTSQDCRLAEAEFNSKLRMFYDRVSKEYKSLTYHDFRCGLRNRCREIIRNRNR